MYVINYSGKRFLLTLSHAGDDRSSARAEPKAAGDEDACLGPGQVHPLRGTSTRPWRVSGRAAGGSFANGIIAVLVWQGRRSCAHTQTPERKFLAGTGARANTVNPSILTCSLNHGGR